MLSLASNLKGSQVFKLQDEHNASFSYVLERVASIHLQKYRILLKSNQISSNYILNPLFFLGSSADFRTPCRNLLNCSLDTVSYRLLQSYITPLKLAKVMPQSVSLDLAWSWWAG